MFIRDAVRRALARAPMGIAFAFFGSPLAMLPTVALGQSADSPGAEEDIKEVVVVGSHIRRDTFNSPSPIQIVTREETTQAGFSGMTDALQGTGITTGASQINNAYGGFVTDGGAGANTISLRNLGEGRTLVLINGRRLAPAGTRGGVSSADLNVLPSAIVERVEVLRDGASSIYGSDAIAGVVNVVTDQNVKGVTVEANLNRPFASGGQQARLSLVGGAAGERWQLSGSVDYYNRSDLTLADRDWTRCNQDGLVNRATGGTLDFIDPLTGQSKCYPITGTGSNGVTINTIGTQNVSAANAAALGLNGAPVGAAGSSGTTFNRFRPNSAITRGVIGFEGVGGGTNNLNVRDTFDPRTLDRSLISPARVYTGFAQGSYDLQALGDAKVYFELLANHRFSSQTGYRQLTLDYRRGSPLIPANLAFSDFGPDQGTSGGARVGVRAFIGFGNDRNEQDVDYYKPTIGLTGKLTFLPEWNYDIVTSYSKADGKYRQQSFLTDKVTYAGDVVTAPAGTDAALVRNGLTCRINLTNPAEKCIPYPVLDAALIAGVLPTDFANYIFREVEGETKFDEVLASLIVNGPVFELPAGKVQAALGAEHRRQKINDTPDPNSIANNLYNLTSATPTRGRDHVTEVFTEVEVPLLADITAVHSLDFSGSYRFTDYESYGSDSTYKVGLSYSPVSWVTLRGARGTSFRAPALAEQYQGATSGFLSQAGDPCNNYGVANPVRAANCALEIPGQPNFTQTQSIRSLSEGGAAAGLFAETSRNVTAGFVLKPPIEVVGTLSLAIDYFDIKIENGVDQPGSANILQRCYDDPDFRAGGGFCRLVTRNPVTNTLTVSNAYTNIATQISKGYDFTVRWERAVGPGRLRLNTQATHYTSQANKLFSDDPLDELNGTIRVPDWSANADLSYTFGAWRVLYGMDWLGSMQSYGYLEEDPATTRFDFDVPDYVEHRVALRYLTGNLEVTAGVRNLYNKKPPVISEGFYNRVGNAPLYSGYDYIGRRGFVAVAVKF